MKVKFMNFKEMAITQNAGMCSYLTIAWAVPYVCDRIIGGSRAIKIGEKTRKFCAI